MKSIKIIATKDTEGFFPVKAGGIIKEINGENVTKIKADSKNIIIFFGNGLLEVYHADRVRLEADR